MKKIILPFVVLFFFFYNLQAANKEPMKYGKPDQTDLEMQVYAPDSSAQAVVLCNYGYLDSRQFQFVHQIRIKILKETGKDFGNFFVPASEKATVRGQVVNLENGKPVITKLSKEGIFIERVTRNNFRARVAMPNVKAGSVIDVEFFYQGLPTYWEFQKTIPVRWSELILEENMYVNFRKNMTGYVPLTVSTGDRWVASNVPAFEKESFVNNFENYLSRMEIEVASINIPGSYYKEYATSWDAVAKTLQLDNEFGLQIWGPNFYMNDLEKEIKKAATDPYQRMELAFNAIKKFKWNNKNSIWPSSGGISYTYGKKAGNCTDINMSLVILLKKLDIDANPMLLSTRDNGLLPQYSVSFDKLNYMAVQAVIRDTVYVLDATEENLPVNMLPQRALNGRAIVVYKDGHSWQDLTPLKKDKSNDYFIGTLAADGTIKGEWMMINNEYAAFDKREEYKSFNSEDDYLKSVESNIKGLSIESYKITNLDSLNNHLLENMQVTLKNSFNRVANQIFLCPFLFDKFTENPFKAKSRLYPVDFLTPIDKKVTLNLNLADGWIIEQLPKSVRMSITDKSASFTYSILANGNQIQLAFRLLINKPVYIQTEYEELKSFFDELVKKQNEMIVLKKA
jgi:hypothetical protein